MSSYREYLDDGSELYVVHDGSAYVVVHLTEDDDEQVSPTFDDRHSAECYLWNMVRGRRT